MIKDIDTIESEFLENIDSYARSFIETVNDRTSRCDDFISISEIEENLEAALANTKFEYLESLRKCLSNIDESEIIKLKKENTQKRR